MPYTESQLVGAVRRIIKNDKFVDSVPLPVSLREAIIKAFLYYNEYSVYDTDMIRSAYMDLEHIGNFVFMDE